MDDIVERLRQRDSEYVDGCPVTAPDYIALEAADEIERLRTELERERTRLAACGVVATADTPESARQVRQMHEDYRSASCDDVARRVDECMRLRAELADAIKAIDRLHDERRRWVEAFGLVSTVCPSMEIDTSQPMKMAEMIVQHVNDLHKLRAALEAQSAKIAELEALLREARDWMSRADELYAQIVGE